MNRPRKIDSESRVPLTLRLPEDLWNKIDEITAANKLSKNKEIVDRLQKSFASTESPDLIAIRAYLDQEFAEMRKNHDELKSLLQQAIDAKSARP